MTKRTSLTGADALAWRNKRNLNQTAFWRPVGVTQSGGSRFESGRNIPKPVQTLLLIAYGSATQRQGAINALQGK